MAFEIASTNLVIELGLILALLLGWQFTLAEFVGGPLMILFIALLFRRFLTTKLVKAAREQADKAVPGSVEGHAAMDMSVTEGGSFWRRLASPGGFTPVAHTFVMEWAAVIRDIILGLLIAGAAAAWIPDAFWQHLFLSGNPLAAQLWGPLIGPLVAIASFVCSIGNAPFLAVVATPEDMRAAVSTGQVLGLAIGLWAHALSPYGRPCRRGRLPSLPALLGRRW